MRTAALLALCALPFAAHAAEQRYRVDLIVFLDRNSAAGELPQPATPPDTSKALEPLDAARLRDAGIEIVPDENFGLEAEWKKLKNSRRLEPLLRLAWIQKDPPVDKGPALHVRWGAPLAANNTAGTTLVYPVDGTVSLLLARYLHLDAELAYTQPNPDGTLASYWLTEKRRMKRDELHHLDSPRLGVLARVEKADQPPKAKPAPPAPVKKQVPPKKKTP